MTDGGDKFEQAFAHHKAGRLADALRLYQEVVRSDPNHAHAWHQLGCIAQSQGQLETAIEYFMRAVRLDGGQPLFHNNLGDTLRASGRLAEAQTSFERACRLKSDYILPRVNLALTLYALGRTSQAEDAAEQALGLERKTPDEHCAAATLQLLRGELAAGFEEHEWRLKLPGRRVDLLPGTKWEGQPLGGRSILVYAEQGLGDVVQFVRYVPRVRELGGRTVLAVPKRLLPLVAEAGLGELAAYDQPPPVCDFHSALLSLPHVFGTTLDSVPADVPYLRPDPGRVADWKSRLAGVAGFRVGIAWQGNPRYGHDRARSIPLAHFEALARVPGVRLVSLQKETGIDQLAPLAARLNLVDLGESLDAAGAFIDTAAVMQNLDLVITSDTSIAHLAGALGVPVWTALAIVPDWRWLLARQDSPWYPTMWLFRQTRAGDWDDVFRRIAEELARRVAGNTT